jgi:hypothetical protein
VETLKKSFFCVYKLGRAGVFAFLFCGFAFMAELFF